MIILKGQVRYAHKIQKKKNRNDKGLADKENQEKKAKTPEYS